MRGGGKFCRNECRLSFDARKKSEPEAIAARFWKKVDKNGPVPLHCAELGPCWLWTKGKRHGGYGAFRIGAQVFPAHVVAYELTIGPLGPDEVGCHKCDNPPCCNPSHVFPGTMKDNSRDMIAKGRGGKTVLSDADVAKVFELGEAGATLAGIGSVVGCHPATAGKILRGEARTLSPQSKAASRAFRR